MQGLRVQSLARELRSYMPPDQKKKKKPNKQNIKQKQYGNKCSEDFQSGPHKKNSLLIK